MKIIIETYCGVFIRLVFLSASLLGDFKNVLGGVINEDSF